jgi:hypothetical protein
MAFDPNPQILPSTIEMATERDSGIDADLLVEDR